MSTVILELIGLLCRYLNNDVTYFDSFELEHIPKKIKTVIGNKNIKTNIFEIQAYQTLSMHPNLNIALNDQQHFRLNKINEIKDYFVAEIKERINEQKTW